MIELPAWAEQRTTWVSLGLPPLHPLTTLLPGATGSGRLASPLRTSRRTRNRNTPCHRYLCFCCRHCRIGTDSFWSSYLFLKISRQLTAGQQNRLLFFLPFFYSFIQSTIKSFISELPCSVSAARSFSSSDLGHGSEANTVTSRPGDAVDESACHAYAV